jgi:hypothetical protein
MFLRLLGAPCLWRATMKTESLLVLVSPIEPHDGWVASTMLETVGLDSLPHDWDWTEWQVAANEKLRELVSERYKQQMPARLRCWRQDAPPKVTDRHLLREHGKTVGGDLPPHCLY